MNESVIPMIRVSRPAWLAVGSLLLCASAGAQPGSDQITALCTACHRDKFETTVRNPHNLLDSAEWRSRTGNAPGCLNCHGDVVAHISAGGGRGNVFAFRDEAPSAQNDRCRTCHTNAHPEFDSGAGAQAGLTCAGCHSQHGANESAAALLRPSVPAGNLTGFTGSAAFCGGCRAETVPDLALDLAAPPDRELALPHDLPRPAAASAPLPARRLAPGATRDLPQ